MIESCHTLLVGRAIDGAAEQGLVEAQYNLGGCYKHGRGVSQDPSEAATWYRKAAEQGHAGAQTTMGVCYQRGTGVPKDPSEAATWYRRAAEQGDEDVETQLHMLGLSP